MSKTNVQIVSEYIEQVINQKQLEKFSEFCRDDCIIHSTPYVGLGVNFDDSSGTHLVLANYAAGGPVDGHLQIGDELVRVKDGDREWETFEELKSGLWGQGVVDTEITLTVRRHGNLLSIPIKRGQVKTFDRNLLDVLKLGVPYMLKFWPDLRSDIKLIFGEGDYVTCYAVNHGTNLEYSRTAVWGEIDIIRLKSGKIAEMWTVEDSYAEVKQLGFDIKEPVREPA